MPQCPTCVGFCRQGIFGTIPWTVSWLQGFAARHRFANLRLGLCGSQVMGNNLLFFKLSGLEDWQGSLLASEGLPLQMLIRFIQSLCIYPIAP
jgi:hypothetical protein